MHVYRVARTNKTWSGGWGIMNMPYVQVTGEERGLKALLQCSSRGRSDTQ